MLKNLVCDRDGTIIYDRHYLCEPNGVELLPGAVTGLQRLVSAGLKLFVATNQSGIGRKMYTAEQYMACERRLDGLLAGQGVQVTGTVFCPHAPEEACNCRKPKTGLWEQLQTFFDLRPEESVMIGDKPADIDFGKNCGFALTILVLTGKGAKSVAAMGINPEHQDIVKKGYYCPSRAGLPDCIAPDLDRAADFILTRMQK